MSELTPKQIKDLKVYETYKPQLELIEKSLNSNDSISTGLDLYRQLSNSISHRHNKTLVENKLRELSPSVKEALLIEKRIEKELKTESIKAQRRHLEQLENEILRSIPEDIPKKERKQIIDAINRQDIKKLEKLRKPKFDNPIISQIAKISQIPIAQAQKPEFRSLKSAKPVAQEEFTISNTAQGITTEEELEGILEIIEDLVGNNDPSDFKILIYEKTSMPSRKPFTLQLELTPDDTFTLPKNQYDALSDWIDNNIPGYIIGQGHQPNETFKVALFPANIDIDLIRNIKQSENINCVAALLLVHMEKLLANEHTSKKRMRIVGEWNKAIFENGVNEEDLEKLLCTIKVNVRAYDRFGVKIYENISNPSHKILEMNIAEYHACEYKPPKRKLLGYKKAKHVIHTHEEIDDLIAKGTIKLFTDKNTNIHQLAEKYEFPVNCTKDNKHLNIKDIKLDRAYITNSTVYKTYVPRKFEIFKDTFITNKKSICYVSDLKTTFKNYKFNDLLKTPKKSLLMNYDIKSLLWQHPNYEQIIKNGISNGSKILKLDRCNSFRSTLADKDFRGYPTLMQHYKVSNQQVAREIAERFEGNAYIIFNEELKENNKFMFLEGNYLYPIQAVRDAIRLNINFTIEYIEFSLRSTKDIYPLHFIKKENNGDFCTLNGALNPKNTIEILETYNSNEFLNCLLYCQRNNYEILQIDPKNLFKNTSFIYDMYSYELQNNIKNEFAESADISLEDNGPFVIKYSVGKKGYISKNIYNHNVYYARRALVNKLIDFSKDKSLEVKIIHINIDSITMVCKDPEIVKSKFDIISKEEKKVKPIEEILGRWQIEDKYIFWRRQPKIYLSKESEKPDFTVYKTLPDDYFDLVKHVIGIAGTGKSYSITQKYEKLDNIKITSTSWITASDLPNAETIHKTLKYLPTFTDEGIKWAFSKESKDIRLRNPIVIIDEAYKLPKSFLDHAKKYNPYVFFLLVGDPYQLQPIEGVAIPTPINHIKLEQNFRFDDSKLFDLVNHIVSEIPNYDKKVEILDIQKSKIHISEYLNTLNEYMDEEITKIFYNNSNNMSFDFKISKNALLKEIESTKSIVLVPRKADKPSNETSLEKLKVGDNIILLEKIKGYKNGMIAEIIKLPNSKDTITVKFLERYKLTNDRLVLDLSQIGKKFESAKYMTIAKSQGQTFGYEYEKIYINISKMKNMRDLYVAISRAKSLEQIKFVSF